jgi:hypothetical protein
MNNTAFRALVLAWTTTMAATSLFVAALALSRVWDDASYWEGLQRIMNLGM